MQRAQSPFVTIGSQSGDLPEADRRGQGAMAKLFPPINIADMNFNGWQIGGGNGIPYRYTGVGVGGGIDNDAGCQLACRADPIDQFSLMIRLSEIDNETKLASDFLQMRLDIAQGQGTVDVGFPISEQLQVWPVEYKNRHAVCAFRLPVVGMGVAE